MDRQYKFRAWNKEGNYFANFEEDPDYMFGMGRNTLYLVVDGDPQFNDKWILSQFTGLKDKNGKEIYEKDFVLYQGNVFKIVYHTPKACYSLEGINSMMDIMATVFESQLTEIYTERYFEVIGNEFENPELPQELNKHLGITE